MGFYDTYYRAAVRSVSRLTPNLIRVCFGGGDLAAWSSTGRGDERLVVVFPSPGDTEPPGPQRQLDGTYDYPDTATRPPMRSYTVRAWDERNSELLVDFVIHSGGIAAAWARTAEPGQVVYLTAATGWYDPPADTVWELLVADMAGLPALARILELLPAGRRAHVIAEVIEPGDAQPLTAIVPVETCWLYGDGNGVAPSGLLDAVRDFRWPAGPGYVWVAAEAAESRAVRKHLRRELGWSPDRYDILGYWRARQEEWLERYERIGPGLEQVYTRAVAQGQSSTDALELYDDALERAGL